MSRTVKILVFGSGTLLILAGAFLLFSPGRAVGDGQKSVMFEVKAGSGVKKVTQDLQDAGLLRSPQYFQWMLRLSGGKVKAGLYDLNDGMSAGKIASAIASGKVHMITITVPEGWHNRQIAQELVEKGITKTPEEFLRESENPEVLKKYNILGRTTEGYLFPETYSVPHGFTAAKLQELMLQLFFKRVKEAEPPADLTPQQMHEKVILASIIEREALKKDELPIMSQVFLNRLDKKMKLESCATIQYLFDKPHKKLYDRDLVQQSPYNTYIHKGLPPGPISNPGIPALRAAFHPEPTDTLFFVVTPDGSHHFSKTFKEHLEAKQKYLGGHEV